MKLSDCLRNKRIFYRHRSGHVAAGNFGRILDMGVIQFEFRGHIDFRLFEIFDVAGAADGVDKGCGLVGLERRAYNPCVGGK